MHNLRIFTDAWTSIGLKAEERREKFSAYQFNEELMSHAAPTLSIYTAFRPTGVRR